MAPASVMSSTPQLHAFGERGVESQRPSGIRERMNSLRGASRSSISSAMEIPAISSVMYSLHRCSEAELGPEMSDQIMDETHISILEWIAVQRMSRLPGEGSNYDKVLSWTQLFVEKLHSFELATDEVAGDSRVAIRMAYGYCAILLKVRALSPFYHHQASSLSGFADISGHFCRRLWPTCWSAPTCSASRRRSGEHLVLAITDLVAVVASVAIHFYKAIRSASNHSIYINIYSTFAEQIKTFRDRCGQIAESLWRHQLLAQDMGAETVSDVKSIKSWLAPEDRVLTNVTGGGVSLLAQEREELTCLWVGPHVTRFLRGRDTVLSISGKPGCGKTVASSVIVDFLQRHISGVYRSTLYVPIDSNVPVETATRAIAKTVMGQLLDKRVGNIQLLQALRDAYKTCQKAATNDEYDDAVWSAMGRALGTALPGDRELVLVVDGIDDASCDEKAMFQRLVSAVSKAGSNVRLITLGRAKFAEAAGQSNLQITDGLIFDDIMAVVKSHFESDNEFGHMSEFEQESIVSKITEGSAGSFLWAKLATKRLRRAVGLKDFRAAVEKVTKTKPTTTEFVRQTIHSASVTDEARLMLMWLVTAERPLSLKELGILSCLQIDNHGALSEARIEILATLKHVQSLVLMQHENSCISVDSEGADLSDARVDVLGILKHVQDLVFMQHGLMCIRHGLLRDALRELQAKGQLVPSVTDAHGDLATRLLFYIKTVVPEQHEPSVHLLDDHDKVQLLNRYPLLDFAVRHWPVHLTKSRVLASGGVTGAAKAFGKVLPRTVTSLRLQATLWQHCPVPMLLAYQMTVTALYRECFTVRSPLTLQCIIYLAVVHRQLRGRAEEAAALFFEAAALSRKQCPSDHMLAIQMADVYIRLIEEKAVSSRVKVLNKLEQIFSVLVECYNYKAGQTSSAQAAGTLRRLAEYYRSIKEDRKYEQVMESILSRVETEPEVVVSDAETDLQVQLKVTQGASTVVEEDGVLHLDVDERDDLVEKPEEFVKDAERCVKEGRIEDAEKIYIDAWQLASREYSAHRSGVWAERSLRAVLSYSQFLRSQKRTEEASALLVSVWEEYSRQSSALLNETSVSLLVQVASAVRSMGLLSVSLAISRLCLQYFRAIKRTQTSIYKQAEEAVQSTSQELLKWASSSQMVTSENYLEELVSEYAGSITTMRPAAFASANSLISLHLSQHRWQHACDFTTNVLRGIWPSLFSADVLDIALVQDHVEDCIGLASRLAECYSVRRCRADEEDIRIRVYRALRSGRGVDDKTRERATQALLSFYEKTSRIESGLAIRQEMLDDLTARHGEQHATVLKALWDLAELTRPRPASVGYYQKIIRALNGDAKASRPEALEPILFVAAELWRKDAFSEALPYYATLFNTFFAAPKTLGLALHDDQPLMRQCFDRYLGCLRHASAAFAVLHQIAAEFQAQCRVVYGALASITIHATLTLAKLCQESKTTETQAMVLYEELLKTKSQEIDLHEISSELEAMYEEQVAAAISSSSSSSPSSVALSPTQLERVVGVLRRRFSMVHETYGWADEASLALLRDLIRFENMQPQHETQNNIARELEAATANILTTYKSPAQLVAAAKTIASCYTASKLAAQAAELADELYRQLVMKDTSSSKAKHGNRFDLPLCGRESLVFLAQLEYSLGRSTSTLTEIMAALVAQSAYFVEFRALFQSQKPTSSSSFLDMSVAAARILKSLKGSGLHAASARVFDQYAMWVSHADSSLVTAQAKLSPAQVRMLLKAILGHLSTHRSHDMVRTVGIIGNTRVAELLDERRYDAARDLAGACFKVIAAKPESYKTAVMAKLVLTMGMQLGRRAMDSKLELAPDVRKSLLETSKSTLDDVLSTLIPADDREAEKKTMKTKTNATKFTLAKLDPTHLHRLLILLGAQQNYRILARVLTVLWESREAQHDWDPRVTFTLARRYILALYAVGDSAAALRIAEHIVYNCRRVHGLCHPATLEMARLLARLYSGVAQRHQQEEQQAAPGWFGKKNSSHNGHKVSGSAGAAEIANRYYRKSAAIHEDILRGLRFPGGSGSGGGFSRSEPGLPQQADGNNTNSHGYRGIFAVLAAPNGEPGLSEGHIARQHLWLLRLALERAGGWPSKGYVEYERLGADVLARYPDEMQGVAGVETWDLAAFGCGRAQADDDLLRREELMWWGLLQEKEEGDNGGGGRGEY
ncbi:NACHT domain protein [Apiospora rasikravindrae]|uniref:NACHT domain protein n=1 Tax=Apiospora rasikravindrae TaxID=990691 RepID=A0ABR1UAC1_9PEZI